MVHFLKIFSLLFFALPASLPATTLDTTDAISLPQDYTAVYRVMRNNKNLAEVTIRLSHQDDIWTLHGFTHDMRGLANFLHVKGSQTTTGTWQDGRFIPTDYQFSFSVVGYKSAWQADFNWPASTVTISNKSGQSKMSLADGAIDPFSLSLDIRSQLEKNQARMAVNVLEEDEIKNQMYQADREEQMDTALGCMDTTRVKRIRKNEKRQSLVWYANNHSYVPVLIQHSRKKGNDFQLQIISLDIGGHEVQAGSPCKL